MKNTFGNTITLTIFGESHGPEIGAVLDGLAPGIAVSEEFIRRQLTLRRPSGSISTARVEPDPFRIVSGVFEGKTTGTPLAILIPNRDVKSDDYDVMQSVARPGHADYTSYVKYGGYADYRGGGHSSGRLTAAIVAAGAILIGALEEKGIRTETRILKLGGREIASEDEMKAIIRKAAEEKDSVGGILEITVEGIPAGVGEPWFDSVESMISHAMFSIPGVKGIEFGDAWAGSGMRGSEFNDALRIESGNVVTTTNHSGGINGGITNGMTIVFRLAVRPTPSIGGEQDTVNFRTMKNETLTVRGRHDPAFIHRIRPVADSLTALVLADLLTMRYGTDYLRTEADSNMEEA